MAEDPFPRERVALTMRRLPAYLKLSWRLARDPLLSRARRAGVVAAAGYLVSPVDLVPGVIPVLGQLDDIAVALGAIRFALAGLDARRRREHLAAVGLEDGHLADDLRTVGATSAWLVRAGARTTGKAAKHGGRLAAGGVRVAGRVSVRTVSVATTTAAKAAPAARATAARAAPAAKGAATSGASALRGALARGGGAVRGARLHRPTVRVSIRRPPALGPGAPAGETLEVEADPGPADAGTASGPSGGTNGAGPGSPIG